MCVCVLEEYFLHVYSVLGHVIFFAFDLCCLTSHIVSVCSKSNIFLFAVLFALFLLLFLGSRGPTSSHALFLLFSLLCSLFDPLSPLSLSQDETVGEVSLAFAGGLPRCLGDALL